MSRTRCRYGECHQGTVNCTCPGTGTPLRTRRTAPQIYTISPWAVPIPGNLPAREVSRQADALTAAGDGQVEPIPLLPSGDPDVAAWPPANEQIQAARELGWPVILVTVN